MSLPPRLTTREIGQHAKAGALWSSISSTASKGLSLLLFIVLARLLSPEIFGLLAAAGVVTGAMAYITEQGLGYAIVQRKDLQPAHVDTAFWLQMGLSLVLLAVGMVLAPWVAGLYELPRLTLVIRVLLLGLPLSALSAMPKAMLERGMEFGILAKRRVVGSAISGILAVTLAVSGAGVWSLVFQLLALPAVDFLLLRRLSQWRPGSQVRVWALRDLMSFSVGMFLLRGVGFLRQRAEHLLIGMYLGPAPLGLYTVAERGVDTGHLIVISPFASLGLSMFSRLHDAPAARQKAYRLALAAITSVSTPAFLALAVLGPDLVALLLGQQWAGAGLVLRVMSAQLVIRSLASVSNTVILATGHSLLRASIVGVSSLLALVAMWIVVSRGVVAVTIAGVTLDTLTLPVSFLVAKSLADFDLRAHLRVFVAPMLGCVAMATAMVAVRYWVVAGWPQPAALPATAALGGLLYVGVMWMLDADFRWLTRESTQVILGRVRRRSPA